MIFDKYYDRSLDLMLYGDKDKHIEAFLKVVPLEFCEMVQEGLRNYRKYLKDNKDIPVPYRDIVEFNDSLITEGDMLYWYSINIKDGSLNLGECVVDGDYEYDQFMMVIYPFGLRRYDNMNVFDVKILGEITYNYYEQLIGDDIRIYDSESMIIRFVKFPFNKAMIASHEYLSYLSRLNLVDMKDMKCEYNLSDLINRKEKIRSRKKF